MFHIYQMLCFRGDQEGTHGSVAPLRSCRDHPGAQFPHSRPETCGAYVRCCIQYTVHCHPQVFRKCWYYLQLCVITSVGQNIQKLSREIYVVAEVFKMYSVVYCLSWTVWETKIDVWIQALMDEKEGYNNLKYVKI